MLSSSWEQEESLGTWVVSSLCPKVTLTLGINGGGKKIAAQRLPPLPESPFCFGLLFTLLLLHIPTSSIAAQPWSQRTLCFGVVLTVNLPLACLESLGWWWREPQLGSFSLFCARGPLAVTSAFCISGFLCLREPGLIYASLLTFSWILASFPTWGHPCSVILSHWTTQCSLVSGQSPHDPVNSFNIRTVICPFWELQCLLCAWHIVGALHILKT